MGRQLGAPCRVPPAAVTATLPQLTAFGLLAGMMVLFVWGRWRYDLVAVPACSRACWWAWSRPRRLRGFSNDIVIIVGCALVVSAAVARSGVVERAVQAISPHVTGFRAQLSC